MTEPRFPERVCPVCGELWMPNEDNYRNLTCSQSCGSSLGSSSPWTDRHLDALRALYRLYEGRRIPLASIAEALEKEPGAVRYKAHELGLTDPRRPKWSGPTHDDPKIHERQCEGCREWFQIKAPSSTQRFCTRSCAALSRRPGRSHRNKQGFRDDLGIFVRSSWEANYARVLEWRRAHGEIVGWRYEPRKFDLGPGRGARSYVPDFQVFMLDGSTQWHEVKGQLNGHARAKLARFMRAYPAEHLTLIGAKEYRELATQYKGLVAWE